MSPTVHVAVARVYRSTSSYGEGPFTIPAGSPKIVTVGREVLEVHFGRAPTWLGYAETRTRIEGEAMLRGMFQGEPIVRDELDARLSAATEAPLVDSEHRWVVAFILRSELEWPDEDVADVPWLWCNPDRFLATKKEFVQRIPSVDLAARAVKHFVPNVLDDVVVKDRVYVARDVSFADAFGMADFTVGIAGSSKTQIDRIGSTLATTDLDRVLSNAIAAPAVPRDMTRPDRFKAALRDDVFVDDGGSYGRYELLREMQPVLVRASPEQLLAVMFIDMNGLKQINDDFGHDEGDAAIAAFRAAVRSTHSGFLFRTGGDEFVLFALGSPTETVEIANKMLKAIGARQVRGRQLSASIGIVQAADPLEHPQAIIKRADQEMYRAKRLSRESPTRRCTLAVAGGDVKVVDV